MAYTLYSHGCGGTRFLKYVCQIDTPYPTLRYDEESLVRRRQKSEWEGRRKGILFAYEMDSYFSSSSALYM